MTPPPLRLAFLLPHFHPGGAERVVLNLLRRLDRERFAAQLFLSRREGAFLDLLPADIPVIALGNSRARRLPRLLRRVLEDMDLAYAATNAMNLALLASKAAPLKIVSEHTSPGAYLAEAKHPRVRRLLMRHLYPRADAVAVPTGAIAAELQELLKCSLPTLVLPNPVVDKIEPRSTAPRARPRLVAAGRLVPAKGFDLLIEAACLLRRQDVPFELDIFGEGPLRGALERRIAELGLEGEVRLRGHAADMGPALAQADLFVLSSRREGFGNVVVEAMAAGVPVLAAACDGPKALIRDGISGFLTPPEDVAALAGAIAKLLGDPARRESVAPAALVIARRYEVAAATAFFETALTDLAAARGGAQSRPGTKTARPH